MKHQLTVLTILSTTIISTTYAMENERRSAEIWRPARSKSYPNQPAAPTQIQQRPQETPHTSPTYHYQSAASAHQPTLQQRANLFIPQEQAAPQYIPIVIPTTKEQKFTLRKAQFCAELLRTYNNGHENVPVIDATEATREHSRIFLEAYTGNLSADGYNTAEQIRSYSQPDSQ